MDGCEGFIHTVGVEIRTRTRPSCPRFSQSGSGIRREAPQIHGRVGAPRTPRFGAPFEFARTFERQGAQQAKIARWERIGLAQRSHRDILRGPVSDAWDLAKTPEKIVGV